jgi:hypothetical protein
VPHAAPRWIHRRASLSVHMANVRRREAAYHQCQRPARSL